MPVARLTFMLSNFGRARRHQPASTATAVLIAGLLLSPHTAEAKYHAPGQFCEVYPEAPACFGTSPSCSHCHSLTQPPPVLNAYGDEVQQALNVYAASPLSDAAFAEHLPLALADIEQGDADGDGHENLEEILAGTGPGNEASVPGESTCPSEKALADLDYQICRFDPAFAFRKIGLDFCGISPTFQEMEALRAAAPEDQMGMLHARLDECLDSEHYLGFQGVLWHLGSRKIRPVGGLFDFADFLADYDYFVYTQIDDHDARDVLVGQYFVHRIETDGEGGIATTYVTVNDRQGQPMQPSRRAGLLTSAWPLFYNTMFTALPRGTAANAYRAFLNLDIAQSQGLEWPVAGEPFDYDDAGVQAEACAGCHSVLDPLAYPFATYNGLQSDGENGFFEYEPNRIQKHFASKYPAMLNMPESGFIFGEPVADLIEWADVAANSEPFFSATTHDYWKLLVGRAPSTEDADAYAEFTDLWIGLMEDEQHSVERMLHALIETEAYGAP